MTGNPFVMAEVALNIDLGDEVKFITSVFCPDIPCIGDKFGQRMLEYGVVIKQ